MAATDPNARPPSSGDTRPGSLLAAALLLPGVLPLAAPLLAPLAARAEAAPEQAVIAVKHLDYQDWQPGLKRTRVTAPSAYLLLPLNPRWSLEASAVSDTVSGASPRHHTAVSGASRQTEKRHAGDAKLTHHGERDSWSVGIASSDENDFHSDSLSAGASWSTADNNRSWNTGIAYTRDRIGATGNPALNERRRTLQVLGGLTQNLSAHDVLQANLSLGFGHGFYSDPYKFPDKRPDTRNQLAAMLRWNHHLPGFDATLRSSYRYYADTFGIRAHMVELEWAQPLGHGVRLSPSLRYQTQRAAKFYVDPVYDARLGEPFPPQWTPDTIGSADQRLAGFGALGLGLRLDVDINAHWSADIKLQHYQQRGNWRLGGDDSPGLARFSARWLQLGLSYRF